jgi:plasmid stabilization system protein ParE
VSHSVVFTPEAEDQLVELYRYIAAAKSADVAARYTDAIIDYCQELATFPIAAVRVTTSGRGCARSGSGDGSLSHSLCWTRPWRSSASSTAGAITRRF